MGKVIDGVWVDGFWTPMAVLGLKDVSLASKIILAEIYDYTVHGRPYLKTRKEMGALIGARERRVTGLLAEMREACYIEQETICGEQYWQVEYRTSLTPRFYEKTGMPMPRMKKTGAGEPLPETNG